MASKSPKSNRICLKNVSNEWPSDRLENICREFGKVINLYRPANSPGVAFVTYDTVGEAENAWKKIEQSKMHGIRAEFAYEKKRDDLQKSEPFCYNRTTNTMPARSKTSIDDFRKGSNNHRALNAPASISRATYVSNWDLKVSASQPNSSLIKPQTDMDGEVKFGLKNVCVYCFQFAQNLCERCGDYYCSEACQIKDWHGHRVICFPMPHIITEAACRIMLPLIDAALHDSITHLTGARETNSKEEKGDNKVQASGSIEASINNMSIDGIKHVSKTTLPDEININNCFPKTLKKSNNIGTEINGPPNTGLLNNNNIPEPKMNGKSGDLKEPKPVVTTPSPNGKPEYKNTPEKTVYEIGKIHKESALTPSPRVQPDNNKIVKGVKINDGIDSKLESPLRAVFASRNTPIKGKPVIPESEPINPNDKVVISSVSDIHTVFVRPKQAKESFQNINAEGVSEAASGKKLTALPERNDMVLAPYENHYYRAIVMKAKSKVQPIEVAFIDFGNADEVKFDDLKEISDRLAAHKKVITKITLKPIPEQLKAAEVLSFLDKAVVNEIEFTIQFDSETPIKQAFCDLILPNGKSYLDEIIAVKTVKPEREPLPPILEVEEKSNAVLRSDIGLKIISGQKVDVTLINNDLLSIGFITIILTEDEQTFIANEEMVKTCGQSLEKAGPFEPKRGEICLYKDACGNWYRGECEMEVEQGKYEMHSLDFGAVEKVESQNIRALPPQLTFPTVSFSCIIDEFNTGATYVRQFNEKLQLYDRFLADSIKYDDAIMVHVCRIPDILAGFHKP